MGGVYRAGRHYIIDPQHPVWRFPGKIFLGPLYNSLAPRRPPSPPVVGSVGQISPAVYQSSLNLRSKNDIGATIGLGTFLTGRIQVDGGCLEASMPLARLQIGGLLKALL